MSDEIVIIEVIEEVTELVTNTELPVEVTVTGEPQIDIIVTEEPVATVEITEEPAAVIEFEAGERGPEGAKGDSFAWKGNWVQDTYVVRDVVSYNGSAYVRLISGASAVAPPLDIAGWDLFARGFTTEEISHFTNQSNPHGTTYQQVGAEPAGTVSTHSATPHPTADEKAAMAGTVGPPSGSNKFVTQADSRLTDSRTPKSHTHISTEVTDLNTRLASYQARSERGQPNGYPSLDATGKVPTAQIPLIAHVHSIGDVSSLNTQLSGKQNLIEKGTPGGYAGLDSAGKVPASQLPLNVNPCQLVNTIDDRDRIQDKFNGMHVLVKDASGDITVDSGWATYVYDMPNDEWFKTSEGESLDLIVSWEDVVSKPDLLVRLQTLTGKAGLSCVVDPTASGVIFQYPNYDGTEEPSSMPIIPTLTNSNDCFGSGLHDAGTQYYHALDNNDGTRWWSNSYDSTGWMAWRNVTAYKPLLFEIGQHNMQQFSICGRNSDTDAWTTILQINLPDSAYYATDPLYPWTSAKKQYSLVNSLAYKQFKVQCIKLFSGLISTLREPMIHHWQVYGFAYTESTRAFLKPHRGTNAFRTSYIVPTDELFYCKDTHRLYIGDGNKVGGWLLSPRNLMDLDDVADVDLVGKAGQLLTVNSAETGFELQTPSQALPARVSDSSPLATADIYEYGLGFSSMEVNDLSWPETHMGHLVTIKKDNEYAMQWFAPYNMHVLMYRLWSAIIQDPNDSFPEPNTSFPSGVRWQLAGQSTGRVVDGKLNMLCTSSTLHDIVQSKFKLVGDFEFSVYIDLNQQGYNSVYAGIALTTIRSSSCLIDNSINWTGLAIDCSSYYYGGAYKAWTYYIKHSGTATVYKTSAGKSTVLQRYYRFVRVNSTLYVYYSTDPVGSGWSLVHTDSSCTTSALYVQFQTRNQSFIRPFKVDDFNVVAGNAVFDNPPFGWYEWRYSMDNALMPQDPSMFYRSDGQWAVPMGGGDMTKTVYDTDNDGIVDTASTVPGSGVQQDETHRLVSDTEKTTWNAMQPISAKGQANGYAELDSSGKVPTTQLPSAVLGGLSYQGTWNASTNSPTIPAASSSNKGWYYKVATAGSTSIDGISDWQVGDWLVSNGTTWDKVDNTDLVTSVAGKVGAVILVKGDVGLGNVDNTSDTDKPISSATQTALNAKEASANKGQAGGYAGLGTDGKVPMAQLPAPASGNAGTTELVKGGDTRLTDSRTPVAHNQAASTVSVDTTNFNLNLTASEDTVQKALEKLDDLVAGGGGGGLTPETRTVSDNNVVLSNNTSVLADTSGGAFTLLLPSAPEIGDHIQFIDAKNSFPTNNLTVGRNTKLINGLSEDLLIDVSEIIDLYYQNDTYGWKVDIGNSLVEHELLLTDRYLSNVVEKRTITANCSTVTFTGLNSLEDGDYYLSGVLLNAYTSDVSLCAFINGDETLANYTSQYLQCDVSSVATGVSFYAAGCADTVASLQATFEVKFSVCNGYVLYDARSAMQTASSTNLKMVYRATRKLATVSAINTITLKSYYLPGPTLVTGIKAGSEFRLCKANGAERLIPYSPTDITARTTDYPLKPGEVVYRSYTNATSVPLNIAVTEGAVYEVVLNCSIVAAAVNNTQLNMVGASGAYEVDILYPSGSTSVAHVTSTGTASEVGFHIGDGSLRQATMKISVSNNNLLFSCHSMGNANNGYIANRQVVASWVSTPSTLGTITHTSQLSGKIIIKRII